MICVFVCILPLHFHVYCIRHLLYIRICVSLLNQITKISFGPPLKTTHRKSTKHQVKENKPQRPQKFRLDPDEAHFTIK